MKQTLKQILTTATVFGMFCSVSLNAETLLADLEFNEPAGTDAASVRNDYGRSLKSAENVQTDGEGNLVYTPGDNYFYRLNLKRELASGVYAFDYTLSDFNLENDLSKPVFSSVGLHEGGKGDDKDYCRIELNNMGKGSHIRLIIGEEKIDLLNFKSKIMPVDKIEFRAVLNLDEDRVSLFWRIHKDGQVSLGSKEGLTLGKKGRSIRFIRFHDLLESERMAEGNFVKIDKISLAKFAGTEE